MGVWNLLLLLVGEFLFEAVELRHADVFHSMSYAISKIKHILHRTYT